MIDEPNEEDYSRFVGRNVLTRDWIVCPSCDELVPRDEANEHVCPIEGLEED